jgi:hypothetical protein
LDCHVLPNLGLVAGEREKTKYETDLAYRKGMRLGTGTGKV